MKGLKIQLLGIAGLLLVVLQDHLWEGWPWWRYPHIGEWGLLRGIPWRAGLILICVALVLVGFFWERIKKEK